MDFNAGKFIDVDGIRTRYFEKGTGEPMLLVHGGNMGSPHAADCAADWNLNFDGLAKHFRVIAVDKIGQGLTDNPKRDDDYTMHATVQHVYGFMKALKLDGVHLVGHSRGGYLTCRLTLERPEIVKSCIIIDSNTGAPGQGRNHIRFADWPKPILTRESQRWVLEKYSYNTLCVTEDWLDELMRVAARPQYREAVARMEEGGLINTRFQPGLARDKAEMFSWICSRGMPCPTLMIWGLNDPTATINQGFALLEMLMLKQRRMEFQIFNESGHFTYREHPAAFNALVTGFCAQV
ncbi:MAG: alpha/beta hydrolase [Alphaproteobacteria bacterium]|nr:alpha/beta hydrolase [Alphaproteobacteria bacterium]